MMIYEDATPIDFPLTLSPLRRGEGGQRRPSITPIPTFPPQGGRRLRVVNPISKRIFA